MLRIALLSVIVLSGCATTYKPTPGFVVSEGSSAFTFTLTPEQCLQLRSERRTYRSVEQTSIYVGGAGAVLTGIFLAVVDEKVAPAISSSATLVASGVGVFSGTQVDGLDEEIGMGCR